MHDGLTIAFVFLILTDLILLGSSRLVGVIRWAAVQGFLVGLLPLAHASGDQGQVWLTVLFALAAAGIKGFVFPYMLGRALRETDARREAEPYAGYIASLLCGCGMAAFCFWVGARLPLPGHALAPVILPAGLFTVFTGFFLIIFRRKAISQVLGYLVMENGIFALGAMLTGGSPFLVELGVLLDVFVAVFVMGLMIFHINREFDDMDADQLSALRD